MRKPLTERDMIDVLRVLNGMVDVRRDNSLKVRGVSRGAMKFLTHNFGGWIFRDSNGRYYATANRYAYRSEKQRADYVNFDCEDLPIEIIWHVVGPMLEGGSIGFSITKHDGWRRLNLRCREDARNEDIYNVLARLGREGYIHFQTAGSIWEVCKRKREQ